MNLILVLFMMLQVAWTEWKLTGQANFEGFQAGTTLFLFLCCGILALTFVFATTYLLSSTLGLQTQKQTLADMTKSQTGYQPYIKLAIPAFFFMLGVMLGSVFQSSFRFTGLNLDVSITSAIEDFFNMWFFLAYARFCTKSLLGSHTGNKAPTRTSKTLTIGFTIVLLFATASIFTGKIIAAVPIEIIKQAVADESSQLDLLQGIFETAGAAMSFAVFWTFMFGITWLLLPLYHSFTKKHCPACGNITQKSIVIAQTCEHCGRELAQWIFVSPH